MNIEDLNQDYLKEVWDFTIYVTTLDFIIVTLNQRGAINVLPYGKLHPYPCFWKIRYRTLRYCKLCALAGTARADERSLFMHRRP